MHHGGAETTEEGNHLALLFPLRDLRVSVVTFFAAGETA
jgi:hypothetical protein